MIRSPGYDRGGDDEVGSFRSPVPRKKTHLKRGKFVLTDCMNVYLTLCCVAIQGSSSPSCRRPAHRHFPRRTDAEIAYIASPLSSISAKGYNQTWGPPQFNETVQL
ncbi:hypothetical protein BKA93DRAFT_283825 [Sparassis latifolia]|uniref:Uncharacterized protein n=1 Tax=Sparassis crispa TaxID=139825 RepID=A0A401GCC9_9APHY|nr:hypothetical protein SCP_0210060 [Sparassis crispa]GBE79805.1 hypothetical protein SCP_0210060 [Sparassis crispa]